MTYSLEIKASALKEIKSLPKEERHRVTTTIDGLRKNPHQGTLLKGTRTGLRRISSGTLSYHF
ncbi:MAG: hypothetical protein R3C68_18780 [Myxococcota bacterium]